MSKTLGLSAAEVKGRAAVRAAKNGVKRFIALQHLSGPYHYKIGNKLFLLSGGLQVKEIELNRID
tara:strand:- start:1636 stop:1830 length:195 start_codon:yes stop_codon:yes gene_type:complete